VCPMLPVSLYCTFLIAHSVFSNVSLYCMMITPILIDPVEGTSQLYKYERIWMWMSTRDYPTLHLETKWSNGIWYFKNNYANYRTTYWKESLNSDCQQFPQHQQNEQSPLTCHYRLHDVLKHIQGWHLCKRLLYWKWWRNHFPEFLCITAKMGKANTSFLSCKMVFIRPSYADQSLS
jgi:hypothetical protein